MRAEQGALFGKQSFKGQKQQSYAITPPTPDMTLHSTLPAYHAYLSGGGYSKYTPDDFTADLKRFGQFTASRPLSELQTADLQQWIGELRKTMPPKTVSRKIAALINYFRWLSDTEHVLEKNPAETIRAHRVTSPLPDLLFDTECDQLLSVASKDPRPYLLILLLLETGLKKAELLELKTTNFDFSNRYQPELWVKHSGKQVFKDRKLKLPSQVIPVFEEYIERYDITDTLFPYTPRFIEQLIAAAAKKAGLRKQVTPSLLRDVYVVRCLKRGEKWKDVFTKIGLSKRADDDARKKYGRLTSGAL